jgi:ornithine cyclodeaminase/alanine dehydrogenase-like protein (mu-crystallin family)
MLSIRMVSGAQVRELLSWDMCIDAISAAMMETSNRNVSLPLRHGLPIPNGNGTLGLMYGYLGTPESFGVKLVSLFPGNAAHGLSTHMGLVVLYEPATGRPVSIMDASAITAIRTAAASAVATRQLAQEDSTELALLGTGEQAEAHLQAMLRVRDFRSVRVWGRNHKRVDEFIERHRATRSIVFESAESAEAAVDHADVICTVTSAPEPILLGRWVKPGTHVNLVGSSFPDRSEVDTDLLLKARFFVDYRESALAQAGEFLRAKKEGAITDAYLCGEIGSVISGNVRGRRSNDEITIYKSLGIFSQDLAAAMSVWRQAELLNVGTTIEI